VIANPQEYGEGREKGAERLSEVVKREKETSRFYNVYKNIYKNVCLNGLVGIH
jgi:hypothetical protein